MSDGTDLLLAEAAERALGQLAEPAGAGGSLRAVHWHRLDQTGFGDLLRDAERGGAEGTPAQLASLAEAAGRKAVAQPLVQTIVGRLLLDLAGIEPPSGPLAVAFDGFAAAGGHVDVPWARGGEPVVVVATREGAGQVGLVTFSGATVENLAGEPEGRLQLGSPRAGFAPISPDAAERCRRLMALAQGALISGALAQVLDMTLGYIADRSIFGKKMKSFQVIQHEAARMAEEVSAARLLAQAAARDFDGVMGEVLVAAARARLADAVDVVAGAAHQLHGAMGFTLESPLQRWTKRLWAWRDQYGSAVAWRREVGRHFIGVAADELWPLLSGTALAKPAS